MARHQIRLLILWMIILLSGSCASSQPGRQKESSIQFSGGKWLIQEIGGTVLVPVKSGDVPAFVDFIMEEKRMSAFAGCNRMSSGFTLSHDTITIAQMVATRMACPDMEYEYRFEETLAPGSYTFKESGDKLQLFQHNKKILLLKRSPTSTIK